jgi:prepilin-type N-terminal cleavage/methylation domain-containing protein
MRKTRRSRGVTLAELMVVLAIVSIVVALGDTLFVNVINFYQLSQARIDVQRDARTVFDLMERDLRQAVNSTIVIDQATGQPPYSRITFQNTSGVTTQYYQSGTNLYMVVSGTHTLTNHIEYIAFSHPRTDEPSILSISLTLSEATYKGGYKALQLSMQKVRIMN